MWAEPGQRCEIAGMDPATPEDNVGVGRESSPHNRGELRQDVELSNTVFMTYITPNQTIVRLLLRLSQRRSRLLDPAVSMRHASLSTPTGILLTSCGVLDAELPQVAAGSLFFYCASRTRKGSRTLRKTTSRSTTPPVGAGSSSYHSRACSKQGRRWRRRSGRCRV